ncbi:MAG TPA: hypothetical protein VJQ53_01740, partial [Candidatus Eisenbacteria bacterium]|nr:hypothetical protein [Candidatus Eisenbacteria bacterium]
QMNKELNRNNVPTYEAQAANGVGVFETLRGVSKLLLTKISKDVIDRDRGSLAASPRVKAEDAKQKPAAVEEAPTQTAESPGRGKLMQFLKRGKGQEAQEKPARSPEKASAEEVPMLSEDSLVEESLSGGAFKPPAAMQPDEGVLTQDDLVPIREPVITRQDDSPGFAAGEIERESTYGSRSSSLVESSGDTRQITVPIELGSLPASGKIKVVFEVRIEVVDSGSEAKKGKKSSSRGGSMMRDLEVIPD